MQLKTRPSLSVINTAYKSVRAAHSGNVVPALSVGVAVAGSSVAVGVAVSIGPCAKGVAVAGLLTIFTAKATMIAKTTAS